MKGIGSAFAGVVLLLLTAAAQEQAVLSRGTATGFSISGSVVHALTGQVLSQAQVTIAGTLLAPESHDFGRHHGRSWRPTAGCSVFLFHSGSETGLEETTQRQQVMSDDEGHYRFGHLPPGRYDVVVVAQPWYAQNIIHSHFRLRSLQEKGTEKAGEAQNETQDDAEPTHSPLDGAYPVTYYASGTDPSQATTVSLNVGEHATADVPLSPVPAFHVRIEPEFSNRDRCASLPERFWK